MVGIGIGKSSEVIGAIQKGVAAARKNMINVPMLKTTIPHPITGKAGAGKIVLRPAAEGTGIIAGGAARAVLGIIRNRQYLCKSLGSDSPLNVARATANALLNLRSFKDVAAIRGLTVMEMLT